MKKPETPEAWAEALGLNRIVDKVLSYKVPARTPKAKKRQRKRRKVQRESCI